jgi:SAM-dependent methyltransferase
LINVFKPVLPSKACRKNLLELLEKYDEGKVVLNLGSGPTYIYRRTDIVNIDLFAFNEVDIVADVTDLPIEDDSVDFIINIALIEHVDDPQKLVREMARILKWGGEIFCYLPFIQPYHAAPHDFYRWTIPGIQKLFAEFQSVEVGLGAGPTSGMLWVFQEWLAIFLSFGSQKLHDVIFMILMVLTAPIKLLDLLLEKFPCAEKIASAFYVIGKKKDS